MVIFGFLAGRKLNKDKCPFCGKELRYTTGHSEAGEVISKAFTTNVLRINSFGELEAGMRTHAEKRTRGRSFQNMTCPRHQYEITRVTSYREEKGKGLSKGNYYEVTRYDYRFVSAGKLKKGGVKKLKRCCKFGSKDILRMDKGI